MKLRRMRLAAALACAVGVFSLSGWARAQEPRPFLPNESERSGLLTRHVPIIPHLPHDEDRDDFFQTRTGDHPPTHPNNMFTSGLYGLRMKNDGVASFRPYFWGSPGSSMGPDSEKVKFRPIGNFFHPWRPVYHYYSGGSYVPVYDLDPICPGPGPYPFSRIYHKQKQGG